MTKNTPDTSGVKSSLRTIAVFEMFSAIQKPASIGEIAEHLSMPQSSTSALIKTLVASGYLEKSPESRTYKPTIRISLLGSWINQSHFLSGTLPDLLEELRNETGETVVLAQRNDIYADYIYGFESTSSIRMHFVPGLKRPLACCAAGWSILKYDKPQSIGKLIRRTRTEITDPRWLRALEHTEDKIAETVKLGFASSDNHASESASAISIAVPTRRRRIRLAITVGGPTDRISANKANILTSLAKLKSQLPISATEDVLENKAKALNRTNPPRLGFAPG